MKPTTVIDILLLIFAAIVLTYHFATQHRLNAKCGDCNASRFAKVCEEEYVCASDDDWR